MRGTGDGHRGWDLQPSSTMTNGSVEQTSTSSDGQVLLLKYKDGEEKIVVPSGIPIVVYVPGERAELKAGPRSSSPRRPSSPMAPCRRRASTSAAGSPRRCERVATQPSQCVQRRRSKRALHCHGADARMRERVRPGRGAIVRNFAGCRRRIEQPLSDGAGWLRCNRQGRVRRRRAVGQGPAIAAACCSSNGGASTTTLRACANVQAEV